MKKILFLGVGFYDYEKAIIEELENQNNVVDYFNMGYSNPLIRISKRISVLKDYCVDFLAKKVLRNTANDYDYVFVIKGELCTPSFLKKLRKKIKARFILYQWDSLKRLQNYNNIKTFFDVIFTFDRVDSINEKELRFRPLFFRNEYKSAQNDRDLKKYEIDICSISHYYNERLEIMNHILRAFPKKKQCYTLTMGCLTYLKLLEIIKKQNKITGNQIVFKIRKLQIDQVIQQLTNTKSVLDIAHPDQSGLTIRSIEALGMKKKLITTNSDIKKYDFFNENNITVIDENNIMLTEEFFSDPYEDISQDIYEKYSIKGWVHEIFA